MPIVQSYGSLQRVGASEPAWSYSGGSISLYGSSQTYATIYKTQPNVRTCVDFLARNVAQLGIPVFRRVSDTDRVRLADHPLASWLNHPNPSTTRYRLIEGTMQDLAVYLNAYWLKVRTPERIGLVRLPPEQMRVEGGLLPTQLVWTVEGREKVFAPSEIVHFGGYDPCNPLMGLSGLETLRQILAEEKASSEHRQHFWSNYARIEGAITQTGDGPAYSPDQMEKFRQQWQDAHAGSANAGKTPLLPKGMDIKQMSFSSRDAEYTSARKLNREEVAAAFHIPLPMVGILEHATFSNIKEQHKHLYQDCLGPWLVMIEEEIERQLLIECQDRTGVYIEFNIAEKLKGSFEEQANALQALVGRPIMTANEGRARLNLPSHDTDDADTLAAQQGGPSDASVGVPGPSDAAAVDVTPVVLAARARQQARLEKVSSAERPAVFQARSERWTRELESDLRQLVPDTAEARRLALEANAETLIRLRDEARHER